MKALGGRPPGQPCPDQPRPRASPCPGERIFERTSARKLRLIDRVARSGSSTCKPAGASRCRELRFCAPQPRGALSIAQGRAASAGVTQAVRSWTTRGWEDGRRQPPTSPKPRGSRCWRRWRRMRTPTRRDTSWAGSHPSEAGFLRQRVRIRRSSANCSGGRITWGMLPGPHPGSLILRDVNPV